MWVGLVQVGGPPFLFHPPPPMKTTILLRLVSVRAAGLTPGQTIRHEASNRDAPDSSTPLASEAAGNVARILDLIIRLSLGISLRRRCG